MNTKVRLCKAYQRSRPGRIFRLGLLILFLVSSLFPGAPLRAAVVGITTYTGSNVGNPATGAYLLPQG
jgi:hypothetical protein